jgi:hypothetical protein
MPCLQSHRGQSQMMTAAPFLVTVPLDSVPAPRAAAPYALAEAPKESPTNTPTMNFAMKVAPFRQVRF